MTSPWAPATKPSSTLAACILLGCSASPSAYSKQESIIYGTDDRSELFDAPQVAQARARESLVALIPDVLLDAQGRLAASVPTLAVADSTCEAERFAAEPAAAFCTGVLIDWDLVLTAGHCTRLLALSKFSLVFDYGYAKADVLELSVAARFHAIEIVAERLDPEGLEPRQDFAVLRLERAVPAPRVPAPVSLVSPLEVGSPLLVIAASSGLPLKVDAAGVVFDPRSSLSDYFVADTDTSHGASGGGAFDRSGNLLGILARGSRDLAPSADGCNEMIRVESPQADEQYSYASSALEALCAADATATSLCRQSCEEPCTVLARQRVQDQSSCALSASGSPPNGCANWLVLIGGLVSLLRRNWRSQRLTG